MNNKNLIRDFLNAAFSARKTVQLYPKNNPNYSKAIDKLFAKATDIFKQTGDIILRVDPQALLSNDEQVYHSHKERNNFAFLFFKEGLRELTFKKEVTREELEEFLNIISFNYDESVDQDLVSSLWERDFKNIKYIVDEGIFFDDDGYAARAMEKLLEQVTPEDKIMAAYKDAFAAENVKSLEVEPPLKSDFEDIRIQLERDSEIKLYKIINIIFELYYQANNSNEFSEITSITESLIGYLVNNDNLEDLIDILKKIDITIKDEDVPSGIKESLKKVVYYAGSPDIVKPIGTLIERGADIDEDTLNEFATYLDKNAIQSFIDLLGVLQNYSHRQMVINVLSEIGRKDMKVLLDSLTDSRWYLVRNIVVIINQIGDRAAASHLIKTAIHPDVRVKTEIIKTIGELEASQAVFFLEQSLNSTEQQLRISAVRALGHIRSEKAKQILIKHIKESRTFVKKDYEEKKCFFEVLCLWKGNDVEDFIAGFLNKGLHFNMKKHYENMSCAAYALGRIGKSEYLPLLKKYEDSSDPLLKQNIKSAIGSIAKNRV